LQMNFHNRNVRIRPIALLDSYGYGYGQSNRATYWSNPYVTVMFTVTESMCRSLKARIGLQIEIRLKFDQLEQSLSSRLIFFILFDQIINFSSISIFSLIRA